MGRTNIRLDLGILGLYLSRLQIKRNIVENIVEVNNLKIMIVAKVPSDFGKTVP